MRYKTLLWYKTVFDNIYKVLEIQVEKPTKTYQEQWFALIFLYAQLLKGARILCFLLAKTKKLYRNHTFELILSFRAAVTGSLHTKHFGLTFQFLISSFLHTTPCSSQAHQSCYLNGWQIEYHSDHATLGILIYPVQGKNAEYKLFRNVLYQRVFSEHSPLAEQTDYFSLLIVLISYLLHWKQRVIRETICTKQKINPVY